MISTRIYSILLTLERKDLNRFLKFIKSPYFNVNQSITDLVSYLVEIIKTGGEGRILSKEEIWHQILERSEKYNDLKFRKLCNDTLERCENFLVNEQLEKSKLLKANLLLVAIKEKDLKSLIEKQTKKSNRYLSRTLEQSSDYFLNRYFYNRNLQSLVSNDERKKAKISQSVTFEIYDELSTNLDAFYIIEKLRFATDVLTWRKLYNIDFKIDISKIQELVASEKFDSVPAVKIYHLMYQLLSNQAGEKVYVELKKLVEEEIQNFGIVEQKEIADALLSYVIKNVNTGKKKALKEILALYDWAIEEEVILEKGFLSPTTFRNYVVAGLRLSEFEIIESFIKNKSKLLKESLRDNAVNFCLARVAFHKKDYSSVLLYLNKVNYEDIWYNVNSRNYLLASYYELDEFEPLVLSINSFLVFLRREKSIEADRKVKLISFASYLKKLLGVRHSKHQLRKLREEIEKNNAVFNKSWLLEKIDELL